MPSLRWASISFPMCRSIGGLALLAARWKKITRDEKSLRRFWVTGKGRESVRLRSVSIDLWFKRSVLVWSWLTSRSSMIQPKHWPLPLRPSKEKYRNHWRNCSNVWSILMFKTNFWSLTPLWAKRLKSVVAHPRMDRSRSSIFLCRKSSVSIVSATVLSKILCVSFALKQTVWCRSTRKSWRLCVLVSPIGKWSRVSPSKRKPWR